MSRDALVVGINTYQSLPGLQAPARDAEAIAQQLQNYGEFRVHRLPEVIQDGKPRIGQKTQVTLRELETALIKLFKPQGSTLPQTAVFYFSGHGIQREAGIREGYLALSDSNPDKGFYGLSLFWLRRLLQESPVRQRIIWLDCCHSGELLNFLEADPGAHPGTDRLFMAASREYETAYESLESPYSIFTQALLSGLDPQRLESGIVTNHSLTDWVNHTLKGEIQQPLFESSGSEIILTRRAGEFCPLPVANNTTEICPYRGLECFDENHADYFFGREDLTAQVLEKLNEERFVAVVGASGSGKSSLVRAGLIAQLKKRKHPIRGGYWQVKRLNPATHPFKSLAATFIDPDAPALERAEQLRRAEVFLQDGGKGLAQLIQASLTVPTTTGLSGESQTKLLLIIDQFEEVFTLVRGGQAEQERQKFFNCLLEALEIAGNDFSIVVVLRADFLKQCSFYGKLAHWIEQHQVMVPPLKYEQIKAAIVRPAQKVGLVCEPSLVYTMLLDGTGAPGELPLLQYTLMELWRRRIGALGGTARLTLEAYQELGGLRGTLQKRATQVFDSLSEAEQVVAKRIFLALTQPGEGTEDTRRRITKAELINPAFPTEAIEPVLEKLIAAKLVVISHGMENLTGKGMGEQSQSLLNQSRLNQTRWLNQEVIDAAHETLIRHWSLLRDWLDDSREMLRRQRRLEQAAQEWDSVGQPTSGEYLLHGLRLRDAEDFLQTHAEELSVLAQQYIQVSCEAIRRSRRETRQIQIGVPAAIVAAIAVVVGQYLGAIQIHTNKNQEIRTVMARERAAIAQSILNDSQSDPMAALLISRLAAEAGEPTYEVQSSLRSALQNLRLQLELRGHQGAIRQLAFSPDPQYLATASADGTIRLWSLNPQTVYNTTLEAKHVLNWTDTRGTAIDRSTPANIWQIAFSPNGQQLAAIAQGSSQVNFWSVESGAGIRQLTASATVTHFVYSPGGEWIATAQSDRTISIWQINTGKLIAQLTQPSTIYSLQFSPDGQALISAGEDGTVRLWQLSPTPKNTELNKSTVLKPEDKSVLYHPDVVSQAQFSSSGKWIITVCKDGKVRVWNAPTGQLHQTLPDGINAERSNSSVSAPPLPSLPAASLNPFLVQTALSPDDRLLATMDVNQRVTLWNLDSGSLESEFATMNAPTVNAPTSYAAQPGQIRFSPDGRFLITLNPQSQQSDHSDTVHWWDVQTGQATGTLSGYGAKITTAQFSPDGTYVATADTNGVVRLWATQRGGELPTLQLPDGAVQWAMFLKNDQRPISQQPEVTAASATQPSQTNHQHEPIADPNSASLTEAESPLQPTAPSSTRMLTTTWDGHLQHWQILTAQPPAKSSTPSSIHTATLDSRGFGHQLLASFIRGFQKFELSRSSISNSTTAPLQLEQRAITGFSQPLQRPSIDLTAAIVAPMPPVPDSPEAQAALSGVVFSSDGEMMAVANIKGWVEIYRIQANQSRKLLHRMENVRSVANGQERQLSTVVRSFMEAVKPNQTDARTDLEGDLVTIRQLNFSADGQQLMGVGDDLTIRLWDVRTGELRQALHGHGATIQRARFSTDGQWIVTASWDRTSRIWQVATGQLVKTLPHQDAVSNASFSPDALSIITTSWDGKARVWNAATGEQQFVLTGHQRALMDAQFSPDGRSIATVSIDGSARLWDASTGVEQALLRPAASGKQIEALLQVFFSPDGQYVAALNRQGQIYLWAATWERLLQLAHDRSLRQLTPEECDRYLRLSSEACPTLPTSQDISAYLPLPTPTPSIPSPYSS